MALRELPAESDSPTSGNQPTSSQIEVKTITGAKRQLVDPPSTLGAHQHLRNSPTNGHLVYVRRKVENDHGKVIPFDLKRPIKKEFKELKSQEDGDQKAKGENSHHLQEEKADELIMQQFQVEKQNEENMHYVKESIPKEQNEQLDQEDGTTDEVQLGRNDDPNVVPALSGESTSASHDMPKAGDAMLQKSYSIFCSYPESAELTYSVMPEKLERVITRVNGDHNSAKADKVSSVPGISEHVNSCSGELQNKGPIMHHGPQHLGETAFVDDLNRLTQTYADSAMSEKHDVSVDTGKMPSGDSQLPTSKYWMERFVRLQSFLDNCDRSSQDDYIRMLRSMTATNRSKHAYELERRAMHLLLEEGKELQRMRLLNVLGKSPTVGRSSLSPQIPKQTCQQ